MTNRSRPLVHRLLSRTAAGSTTVRAPVRMVHIGLGNFHRAHQAWYTARCDDADQWGIAAFTGRSPDAADALSSQDGLYTLVERASDGDRASIIASISQAVDGANLETFCTLIAAPRTTVVTLTITEPGYHLDSDGVLDERDPVIVSDLEALATGDVRQRPATAMGRLFLGLQARYRAGGAPIAIVPCDNIPANGTCVGQAIKTFATHLDPQVGGWVGLAVSFVSTSVDRITPRTTDADLETATRLTGFVDRMPVVTEPFSDWVLSGEFPSGRPHWETAGARFVADVEPFEQRKLWLLNGAHSLLAYLGMSRGYMTVAEAVADPVCRGAVQGLWSEARRHLPESVGVDDYCAALITRFSNSRMEHRLEQIGMEGVAKLRARVVPVAMAEREAGRDAGACAAVLAAWIGMARNALLPPDAAAEAIDEAMECHGGHQVRAMVALLDPRLAQDVDFARRIRAAMGE